MRILTRITKIFMLPLVAHSQQAGNAKEGSHLRRHLQQEANATLYAVAAGNVSGNSTLQTRALGTGTCGGGNIGNALCPDSSLCCSKYGWCGTGSAHCGPNQAVAAGTCGGGNIGNGLCPDSSLCCSKYGWCGTGSAYCGSSPVSSPVASPTLGTCGNGNIGNGRCPDGTLCCSKYGWCGTGSAYCGSSPTPPISAPVPPPTTSQGTVLYSGSGSGTYYYDVTGKTCNGDAPYPENNGYPSCTSYNPAFYKTVQQYGSNNLVAIDNVVLSGNRAGLCGKQIHVYKDGVEVSGGPFFVFDGCALCIGGGRIDFSVSALNAIDGGNACRDGVVPGISWKVTDTQIVPFVP